MQNVKCLKCNWKGTSVDTLKQYFSLNAETQELLMICPECKTGVCVESKAIKDSPNGESPSFPQQPVGYSSETK